MIQLRRNPFSDTYAEIAFKEGESLKDLVDRALELNGYTVSPEVLSHFQVLINSEKIDRDLWAFCTPIESDIILIAPILSGGEGGQIFKQIAIIAIAVVATKVLGPAAGAGIWSTLGSAALVAGATVAGTLLMNALIPPLPLPGLDSINEKSPEDSQMYSITSQSNSAKKFGSVPKVYGVHRIFPLVAAKPYFESASIGTSRVRTIFGETEEVKISPTSVGLVQYLYAIYDFGLGPLVVSDIKIGETSIDNYEGVEKNWVDPNRPDNSEGPWDDFLTKEFIFYKGDLEVDSTPYALDKDESPTRSEFTYRVVRAASAKVEGGEQEISLDFVAPQGLKGYATNGLTSPVSIDLRVEFRKIGSTTWIDYNNWDFVKDTTLAGASESDQYFEVSVEPIDLTKDPLVSTEYSELFRIRNKGYYEERLIDAYQVSYGYSVGKKKFLLKTTLTNFSQGQAIFIKGTKLGRIVSITPSTIPEYSHYEIDVPLTQSFTIFEIQENHVWIPYVAQPGEQVPKTGTFGGVAIERLFLGQDYGYLIERVTSVNLTDRVAIKGRVLGVAKISGNSTDAHYATISFKPREISQFEVRITRVSSYSQYTHIVSDKLSLVSLSTRFQRNPIKTTKRHVFLEVRILATNQLTGAISNLSAVVSSVLDVYDPVTATWSKKISSNPAWVFCDLMTGEVNKKAIPKDRLHLSSLVEWANYCDEIPTPPALQTFFLPRSSCNFILDFNTTLQSIINTVTNAAHASLNIVDGKYGVLIDKLKTVPVQVFTPRNSKDFSSTRSYDETPHALKIRYIDPFKAWDASEVVVYDNGYNENNATVFDELSTFACTNFEQAWRYGRYMLAQARLRKERITISVDFEHIVCTRGDFVKISQDVMRVGGRPARVKEITGANTILLDDSLETLPGVSYGYVYRSVLDGIQSSTCDIIDADEIRLYGGMPSVGDLIVVGEVNKVVFDCIVKSISPDSDLSATLELVEKADDIYLAESSDTLPEYDPQLSANLDSDLAAPSAVINLAVTKNTYRVVGSSYQNYIQLSWGVPPGAAVETYEIYVNDGQGHGLYDFTQKTSYEYLVNSDKLNIPHAFKVLGVSANGKKLTLFDTSEVFATPLRKTTPPSSVTDLSLNITNEVLQMDWPVVLDEDIREYLIRYSPRTTDASWNSSIPLLRVDKGTTLASTQARTGTYLIKAVDFNYNESLNPAQAITTIPNLFDLNIISETNDFPLLGGEKDDTVLELDSLMLRRLSYGTTQTSEYAKEGYYYYANFLDLGEIYTVRLQSLIEARGFTLSDLMSSWETLSQVTYLSTVLNSDWDVETQYRTTDSLNVIAEWTQLSLIDPLSEGVQELWTPWRKFILSDATGRIFQFRLKLVSNLVSVTPRVFEGKIKADMPDRTSSGNNIICPVGGLTIYHTPGFKGPGTSPNIQITQDNAQVGDYLIVSEKTLESFRVEFFDGANNSVERSFDYAAKGYGRKALVVI